MPMPASSRCRPAPPTPNSPTSAPARASSASPAATTARDRPIAALIASRFKDRRLAIVHDDAATGKSLADDVTAALGALGIRPVLTDTYESGSRDMTPLVSRLKDARIEVVFIGGVAADVGLIAARMREAALDAALIGGDAVLSDEFWQASGAAGEGALVTYPPDPALAPEAAALVERFRAAGIEPEGYVLPTYAAIQIFAAAAKKAGSTDFAKLAAAIAKSSFDTVIGKVSFDAKGDMNRPASSSTSGSPAATAISVTDMPANLLTDVAGLKVGNAGDPRRKTGVTVVLCEEPAIASVHVMGGAPAPARPSFSPPNRLSSGSTPSCFPAVPPGASMPRPASWRASPPWAAVSSRPVRVPIVPAAILFDLANGGDKNWGAEPPYRRLGRLALDAAARTSPSAPSAPASAPPPPISRAASAPPPSPCPTGSRSRRSPLSTPSARRPSATTGHFWAAPFEIDAEFGGRGYPSPLPPDAANSATN